MNRRRIVCILLMACAPIAWGDPVQPVTTGSEGGVATQPSVNYRLAAKDTVHIKVFREEDLETTARIDKDGNIAFPLLGVARIGGQTVQQATATMESLLREYLVNPLVSVDIVSYSKRRFTILGEIARPGVFDMPDESSVSLLEAIGMAGGYTKIANPAHIRVKRIVDGREVIIPLNAKEMLDPRKGFSFEVLPGDTISVGEALF